jgi:hypothetical protein
MKLFGTRAKTHKDFVRARAAVLFLLSVLRALDVIGIRQIILTGYQFFILSPVTLAHTVEAATLAQKARTALQSRGKLVKVGLSSLTSLRK